MRTASINLASLTAIQAANAVVPLLIVPWVLSRVGSTAYAQLAVAEAASALVLAFVLFSFEVDGVARVVSLGETAAAEALGTVVSDIVSARLCLFIVGAAVTVAIGWLSAGRFPTLLAFYLLVPLGHVFHSYWFFQGMERNFVPAVTTVLARVASFGLVLMLVKVPADQPLVPLLVGTPFVAAGIASLIIVRRTLGIRIGWAGGPAVRRSLSHGGQIFIGNAAVTLYREMNVLLLSVAGVAAPAIASYSLVEKVIKMIQACTRPLNQLFFPKVLRRIADCTSPSPAAARRVAGMTLVQVAVMVAILAVAAIAFMRLAGEWRFLSQFASMPGFATMFLIMAPATVFGLANFMFGSVALNYLSARGYLLTAILITGVGSATLCLLTAPRVGALAAAACFLFSEAFLFMLVIGRYMVASGQRAAMAGSAT